MSESTRLELPQAAVRFAGDSGDGMQLTGTQFANEAAWAGNDLSTLPNFPAEIRAPAGTLFGVSSFQIQFGSETVHTPGDRVDVLIAMNPAALKVNLQDLKLGGILLVNTNAFTKQNLQKAGYEKSPLDDKRLDERYRFLKVNVTDLTRGAVKSTGLAFRAADRCKNFFCLGIVSFLFARPIGVTVEWLKTKFGQKPKILEANTLAIKSGHAYAETMEWSGDIYDVAPATLSPGRYRQMTGNKALALGLAAAAHMAGRPMVYGAYPITPASDVLHELAVHKNFKVRTFQAEDEIAAMGAVVGAAFGGAIAVTGTSGPGLALKSEALGLAVITELPLVVLNVQRGGPSTGLPTRTEQSDLLQAMYGRNGDCPMIVLAPQTPGDCFFVAYEAVRLSIKYMTPVLVLSDGYIANGAEPWKIPLVKDLKPIEVRYAPPREATDPAFLPYARNEKTLARPWAIPGTKGLEHRIGGLEKENLTGNVCYDPDNHDLMIRLREDKVSRVTADIPPLEIIGDDEGDLLIIGWGSTYGAIRASTEKARSDGFKVSATHIRYLNPFPPDLGPLMARFKKILIPEINRGQLLKMIRAEFVVDAAGLNRVRGMPLSTTDIRSAIDQLLAKTMADKKEVLS